MVTSAATSRPPYMIKATTDGRGLAVGITADASTAVVEMTVHGQWSQHLGSQVAAGLRLCRAGPSLSIIIDLRDLSDFHGVSQPFWLDARRQASLGPAPVRLVLCLPTMTTLDSRLRHSDGPRSGVFATMPEARMAIAAPLAQTRRVQARLGPHAASVRAARELVAEACHAWHLPQVRDACLVMSELAANAVEHARTDFVATASTDGARLHLAVRDGAPRYPQLSEPAPAGPQAPITHRGRGLRLVHAAATAWGAMPSRGGKVVWATVPPSPLL
jgi:anti-sigma regulatory factor (Ser/Thr protein kinase)